MNWNQLDHALTSMNGAYDAFSNLEALFKAIINDTGEQSIAHTLAKLGAYYSFDQADRIDSMTEQLEGGEIE